MLAVADIGWDALIAVFRDRRGIASFQLTDALMNALTFGKGNVRLVAVTSANRRALENILGRTLGPDEHRVSPKDILKALAELRLEASLG